MKGVLILFFFCLGVFCFVLFDAMRQKSVNAVEEVPVRRVVRCGCCVESENLVSRIVSRIASFFSVEESIRKNVPPGVTMDSLGSKPLDSSSIVDPYGVGNGR